MAGVPGFDTGAQLRFVEEELAIHIQEFRPPREPSRDRREFFLENGLFQGGDADLLYAIVRHYRPRRIIELGAGFSTLVSAAACRVNRAEGHNTELISYDPYATPPVGGIDGLAELRPVAAEAVPLTEFGALASGDVLFIDSSHTVRVGGDVSFLLLDVVPRLAPGVLVHVHDVFLPWEYPRDWVANGWYWAEQHLLHALLIGNSGLEVLVGAHAVWRDHGPRLQQLIPHIDPQHPPISFWMQTAEVEGLRPGGPRL